MYMLWMNIYVHCDMLIKCLHTYYTHIHIYTHIYNVCLCVSLGCPSILVYINFSYPCISIILALLPSMFSYSIFSSKYLWTWFYVTMIMIFIKEFTTRMTRIIGGESKTKMNTIEHDLLRDEVKQLSQDSIRKL